MHGDNPSVLADHNAVGVGMDFRWPSDGTGGDRVFIVVEPHQAGLRHRCRHAMEAIELAGIGNKLWALGLEHLPDCPICELGMAMPLGISDELIEQPGVQLVIAFESQPGREEEETY